MKKLRKLLPALAVVMILGPHVSEVLRTDEPVQPVVVVTERVEPTPPRPPATPEAWFARMKSHCTPVNARLAVDLYRPPSGPEGTGYKAACFALAQNVASARAFILGLPEDQRPVAAGALYRAAATVGGDGHTAAAGPLMELVLEFWPNHFGALFEAGVTRYAAGDYTTARAYFERFLEVYPEEDARADSARRMMGSVAER
ncbi:MAG: tetratricopeptide repeat protein [Gemmatimonadota bacterium]|jgi:hypothetical protein